jgi:hypothetical protein
MRAILLILLSYTAFGQTDYFEKYYPLIDQAEEAYIHEEFNSALLFYTSAFKEVEKPLARDLFNGIVCHYMTGDIDAAKPWLLQLAARGVDPALIESQLVFQVADISLEWQKFKPVYQQVYQMFTPDKDADTDQLIEVLQEKMREVRILHASLPDSYFEMDSSTVFSQQDSLKIKDTEAKMDKLYMDMSLHAVDYILEHGLPQEGRYGINSEDLSMDGLRSFLSNIQFYSLLEKSDQFPKQKLQALKYRLLDEVGKGNVHRDYVWTLLYEDNPMEFIKVVGVEDCEQWFLKPRLGEGLSFFENEDLLTKKGLYAVAKNTYFLMPELGIGNEMEVEACSEIPADWLPLTKVTEE